MAGEPHDGAWLNREGGGHYLIEVHGVVARHWEHDLQLRLAYRHGSHGTISTLSGWLPDQAALLGALGRLNMWGYAILLVRFAPEKEPA